MRLDHIAYRVKDRYKASKFFSDTLGYKIGTEFDIIFSDGGRADCIAMIPPELRTPDTGGWVSRSLIALQGGKGNVHCEFHTPPEIFVSDGPPGSIVGEWVSQRGGIGGVHHVAYCVDNVEATMKVWKEKGYAEFLSDAPLSCPGLVQVFTEPSELTGIIYELISRTGEGFCKENVKNLMESTKTI